jgi:hypothetical protein
MNNYQQNRYKMYGQVIEYLKVNKDILKDLPGFKENHAILLNKMEEISKLYHEQTEYYKKKAWDKKALRQLLEEKLLDLSGRLTAFAALTKDPNIMCNCRVTPWGISRLSHIDLHSKGGIMHGMAVEHLRELAPFGITAGILKSLKETTDAFFGKLSEPRYNEVMISSATMQMVKVYKEADEALRYIDLLAGIDKNVNRDFYVGYSFVRKQVKAGSVKMALRAQATEKSTGKPVSHVTFTFLLTKAFKRKVKKDFKIVKKSKKLGGFNIMHMPAGEYEVIVTKIGYREIRMNLVIEDSVLMRLRVEMEKEETK